MSLPSKFAKKKQTRNDSIMGDIIRIMTNNTEIETTYALSLQPFPFAPFELIRPGTDTP
jgi:hypothetical protein